MKQEEIIKYTRTIDEKRMKLLSKRNIDYSEQDIDNGLSNFHDVSTIAKILGINIKASEVAMVLGVLKLVRDSNKKRLGEAPDSEVRGDSRVDFHNYFDLSALCEIEENNPDFKVIDNLAENMRKFVSDVSAARGLEKLHSDEHLH